MWVDRARGGRGAVVVGDRGVMRGSGREGGRREALRCRKRACKREDSPAWCRKEAKKIKKKGEDQGTKAEIPHQPKKPTQKKPGERTGEREDRDAGGDGEGSRGAYMGKRPQVGCHAGWEQSHVRREGLGAEEYDPGKRKRRSVEGGEKSKRIEWSKRGEKTPQSGVKEVEGA